MSYQLKVLDGLFVLRWGVPEASDPTRYAAEMGAEARKQGKKLVGLFIMPEGSPPPNETFRKEQAAVLDGLMDHLQFAVAVFEGSGFATSLKRSALVAILLLTNKRQKVFVRNSVEEALITNPPQPLDFDATRAVATIRASGLCDVPFDGDVARTA